MSVDLKLEYHVHAYPGDEQQQATTQMFFPALHRVLVKNDLVGGSGPAVWSKSGLRRCQLLKSMSREPQGWPILVARDRVSVAGGRCSPVGGLVGRWVAAL